MDELKREISAGLHDEVGKRLLAGEPIIISLPGSFGEALVVTDRRAIVARELASGLDLRCNIHAHLLSQVKGAAVIPLSNGGYLEITLVPPVDDAESARVYFPTSEDARFRAAAEYLLSLPVTREVAVTSVDPATAAESKTCSACSARVDANAPFCPACGAALKIICISCGQSSDPGSVYCSGCGRQMVELSPSCGKCGARTTKWMSYCPDCGSMLRPVCVGCGIQIAPDWTFCASCGRQLGADAVGPQCASAARRRIDRLREVEAQSAAAERPATRDSSASPAEMHNNTGTELFESEDFEGAIREYSAAVQIDPNNAAYHCNLAMAYDEADMDDRALAEYQRTLELDPSDLTALLSIGYMYSENEQPDEARQAWNRVLEIAPDSAEAQEVKQNLRHQGQL